MESICQCGCICSCLSLSFLFLSSFSATATSSNHKYYMESQPFMFKHTLVLFNIVLYWLVPGGKMFKQSCLPQKKQILWIMEFHNFIINEGQRNTQHNHQSLKKQCYKLLSNIVPFLPSSCRLQTQGSQQQNFPLPEMRNMCHCPAMMSGTL